MAAELLTLDALRSQRYVDASTWDWEKAVLKGTNFNHFSVAGVQGIVLHLKQANIELEQELDKANDRIADLEYELDGVRDEVNLPVD